MINKDHLLKLLQQLDEALMKVDDKKDEQDLEGALEIVRASYAKLLDIQILDQESHQFFDDLLHNNALELAELNVLAELLKEEGDIFYELKEYEKSLLKYHQTMDIFDHLNKKQKVFSFEREAKISEIMERINYLEGQA